MDTITVPNQTQQTTTIELDWEAYFHQFCEAHGKYPVMYNGALLFPDGYRYSSSDYQGPEFPPPSDPVEHKRLMIAYWLRRLSIVQAERKKMEHYLTDLTNLQRGHSVPLVHRVTFKDDDGKTVTKTQPVNMRVLEMRLDWLTQDVKDCKSKLQELGYDTARARKEEEEKSET